MQSIKRRCIFCNCENTTPNGFQNWPPEHIIPYSLGNRTLKIYNVCETCNNLLGDIFDGNAVNTGILALGRQIYGLSGYGNKSIPNVLHEAVDENGNKVVLNSCFEGRYVPFLDDSEEGKIKVRANSETEAIEMVERNLRRKKVSETVIEEVKRSMHEAYEKGSKNSYSSSQLSVVLPINLYNLGFLALKVAYEYAYHEIKEKYLEDKQAMKLRNMINQVIKGKAQTLAMLSEVCCLMDPELFKVLVSRIPNDRTEKYAHFIFLYELCGKLYADVSFFATYCLSFHVLVAEEAGDFTSSIETPFRVVPD